MYTFLFTFKSYFKHFQVALASFYENDDPSALVNEPIGDTTSEEEYSDISERIAGSEKLPEMEEKSSKGKPKSKSRFATLNDLKDKESSLKEEEGQAFYAGGSEHSGQQVLGPDKKKKDIVSDMFKSCQAQSVDVKPKPSGQQRPNTFSGTGYKLGQTNSDTEGIL